ncbi:hypothetical protein CTI12_AA532470 [Artemisia annua]|uniref:Transposase MuDR plant domain-containing protein n=1 Tax=Artemisia annua TaxID=35608 RepID=A0A2U1L459_ARTAN|nr:hypothetical protein CTI12_AA532470 [Artemisia annua]
MATTMFFLLLLASLATSNARYNKLPKSDINLLEFPLNLEYFEAEFFLFGALGWGLDYIQPNLTGGGPPPIGARRANLSPLIRDIIAQFGYQEVGHLRAIKSTVPGFPRPLLNLRKEAFANVMNSAFGRPLYPLFDPYANDINYLLACYVIPYVGLTGYVGANPLLQSFTAKKGGNICDGPEGVSYNKPSGKAINVQRGIKFNELINQIHVATSIDKQTNCIKVICRYPSGFGKMMKYIPLPITDNNDIEVMFQILNVYQELSTIDIYLEVETQRQKIARRTHVPSMIKHDASLPREISNERTNELLPTDVLYEDFSIHAKIAHITNVFLPTDVVSKMIENEDFNMISQIAVVNNEMSNGFETHDEDYADDDEVGDDETGIAEETRDGDETFEAPCVDGQAIDSNMQVPACFTTLEGIDNANTDNWTISSSQSKNDLTQELGKDSFKDKEELVKAIKLYSIRKHKQYEMVETCPTIWKIRCRLSSQCGCKWKLRACKRKRSGYFEITQYTGPHTCLHNKITQDHPNLDANLIAQETQHLIKEQPSISIPTLFWS